MADRYISEKALIENIAKIKDLRTLSTKTIGEAISNTPTADVVEVDKVAEMFAEQFGDTCPCNFNDNDEWLTLHCEHTNTCDCPCKEGWKQFIKHYDKKFNTFYTELSANDNTFYNE